MTFEEWIEMGYKLFGSEVMKSFNKLASGQIDVDAYLDEASEAYIKEHNTPTLDTSHPCYGCCHYEGCGYFDFHDYEKTEEENMVENCAGCCCGDGWECNKHSDNGCSNYEIEPILG